MAVDVADWLQLTQLAAPGALGPLTCPNASSTATAAFTVSPFATALVVVPVNVSTIPPTWCRIIGASGLGKYASVTFLAGVASQLPVVAAIPGSSDGPYTVTMFMQSPAAGALVVAQVYQLFGTGVQLVQTPAQQPLPVQLVPANMVLPQQAQLLSTGVLVSIAASTSSTIIAGVGGQYITVYGFVFSIRAAVTATVGVYESTLSDTTAAVTVSRFDVNYITAAGIGNIERTVEIPLGLALPLGAGLRLLTAANPGAMTHTGHVYYTITLPA